MRRIAFLGFLLVVLTGCQTVQQEPRSYQFQTTAEKAQDSLVQIFLADGYRLKSDSPRQLVLEKSIKGFGASLIYGSNWNGTPNARAAFAFTGSGPVTVYVTALVITNPNTGFERETDVTYNEKEFAKLEPKILAAKQLAETSQ